jgi:hypothetical protein
MQGASDLLGSPAFTPALRANDAFNSQTRVGLDEMATLAALLVTIWVILIPDGNLTVLKRQSGIGF